MRHPRTTRPDCRSWRDELANDRKDAIGAIMIIVFFILACTGLVSREKLRYDECVYVGHSETQCRMQSSGCSEEE